MSDPLIRTAESMAEGATTPTEQRTGGVLVELTIPADEFVLAETQNSVPDAEFACERVVESGYETIVPLVWVHGVEPDEVEAAFASDPSVESASLLTGAENRWLYQMEWDSTIEFLVGITIDPRAAILDLSGPDPNWSLHLFYASREEFSESLKYYETHDTRFEIDSVDELDVSPPHRALSERLRRGTPALIENTLVAEPAFEETESYGD